MRRNIAAGQAAVAAAGALGLAFAVLAAFWPGHETRLVGRMTAAAVKAQRAQKALLDFRLKNGPPVDRKADPNGTGFIGTEASSVTTSLGNLQAKRTSAVPDMAGLLVYLMTRAGVGPGDHVAVGASGSFPALATAAVIAAETIGARPLLIVSLGSSEWGGNIPGFSWLEMSACFRAAGLMESVPIAVSLGGDEDLGLDLAPSVRERLAAEVRSAGYRLIDEKGLEADVAARMKLYREAAGNGRISAFVNIGGNWANLGTDSRILKLRPGLARRMPIPDIGSRGVIQAMSAEGVPVIHLLNIRGLAAHYGLPWDPVPAPKPGSAAVYERVRFTDPLFIAACIVMVLAAAVLAFAARPALAGRRPSGPTRT